MATETVATLFSAFAVASIVAAFALFAASAVIPAFAVVSIFAVVTAAVPTVVGEGSAGGASAAGLTLSGQL